MPSETSPLLSVVAPIYNVGTYLRPCLDSLLAGHLSDLEVVCVDDGSTDGSGEIADLYAEQDPRVRVLHVPNGGLAKARNIGLDVATGKYLAFVDSDDRVRVGAYQLMCGSLEGSGSDIATGRVHRFTDTRGWDSGLHKRAIRRGATATHISRMTSLVFDTTAWNKVYRRSFWDQHELRFPEGVLYEDMPVTIPAHVLASAVDVTTAIVYDWRERGDGSMSITQRRAELSNLQDRLNAVESISDFLAARDGVDNIIRAHDLKVLTLDLPLYLDVFDIAGPQFRSLFTEHLQRYLETVSADHLVQLPTWKRVAFELLRRDRIEETLRLLEDNRAQRGVHEVKRRGLRLYAQLPYFRDRTTGVPDAAYDVTKRLPVRSGVRSLELRGDKVSVLGHGFIEQVPLEHPWSSVRWLELYDRQSKHRVRALATPRRRPDLTASHGLAHTGYDWAGFAATISMSSLRAPDGGIARYDAYLKMVAPAARRGVALRGVWRAAPATGPAWVSPDGMTYVIARASGGALRFTVRKGAPIAQQVTIHHETGQVDCVLRLPSDIRGDATLRWQLDDDAFAPVTAPLVRRGDGMATLSFSMTDLPLQPQHSSARAWRASVDFTDSAGQAATREVAITPNLSLGAFEFADELREIAVHVGSGGRFVLSDQQSRTRIAAAAWDGGDLLLTLRIPEFATRSDDRLRYALHHRNDDDRTPTDVTRDGSSVRLRFRVLDEARGWSIRPGQWSLHVRDVSAANRAVGLEIDHLIAAELEVGAGFDEARADVMVEKERLAVHVRSGRESERGKYNQERIRSGYYRRARSEPMQDLVLFLSWGGKQYSDSPRAVYEQMQREGRKTRALWVRRNSAVDLPDGVASVLMWSREFYDALATARRIVANDMLPPYYVKRLESQYVQTWHGTPLKRIGFDIDSPQFSNPNYMDEFRADVAKWDRLISPNPYCTEIFRRAFNYAGKILETGYPRNDVFYVSDVEQRATALRSQFGIRPDQRVVLWAPTWRDNQRDNAGHHVLPLPFDLGVWDEILGPDDVLLLRGHHLLMDTLGGMLEGRRTVRNVTHYGDIQDLYLVADLLITDYSSVMFDFANTRRPMIFYAWDLEMYRDNLRGFYFDFEAEAPGPIVTTLEGLQAALSEVPAGHAAAASRYEAFVQKFCGLEDGHAAERVVKAMLDD